MTWNLRRLHNEPLPERFEYIRGLIDELHSEIMSTGTDGMSASAEEYQFLMLAALDQARRFAALATYAHRQGR